MPTCKECIRFVVCDEVPTKSADDCDFFKDRSRFVELPFPISEGTKLRYIFEDESGRIRAGEDWETVTRVCKDGFYVSGRLDSDGTYQQGAEIIDAISTWDRDYKNQVLNLFKRWNRRTPDA